MELWSGVIGAALSAVLATLVAIFVVLRTNRAQGIHASRARDQAYTDSRIALREQAKGLSLQLEAQSQEMARSRSLAAFSDALAIIEEILNAHEVSLETRANAVVGLTSALTRVRLDGLWSEADDELRRWPRLIDRSMLRAAYDDLFEGAKELGEEAQRSALTSFSSGVEVLATSDSEQRWSIVRKFELRRLEITGLIDRFDSNVKQARLPKEPEEASW